MGEEKKKAVDLSFQKRLAADLLKCGERRVWIDPTKINEIAEAITREEIRIFIHKGWIKKKPVKGTSRARARILHEKRKKGRRRGHGKRKGKKTAREDPKRIWIYRVRKMRRYVRYLVRNGFIDKRTYRRLRSLIKGGFFRNFSHLRLYVEKELGVKTHG